MLLQSRVDFDRIKDLYNAAHGNDTTSNEDTLLKKEDSFDADDCISTITFTDEDLLLRPKLHNNPLFVVRYTREQQINMKQPSKLPLKGFVSSTQEEEGGHEALAIDEKGFDPKSFKLLVKARYNPKEKLSLGKLPHESHRQEAQWTQRFSSNVKGKGTCNSRFSNKLVVEDGLRIDPINEKFLKRCYA
ncbi:UNVERIFIED_CONTAM: hypothetical protein Scaly_0690700 [Sesamum calycinum]|uniref:Uncharacterized protein n=1 Tax=Sesamum calycinum TaxID=2727403 RepID=A0AAW2R7W6_9LAMI